MKAIKECPVCNSDNLEQEYKSVSISSRYFPIGATTTSVPKILNGCFCRDCGSKNVFNVYGKCEICNGTGFYEQITGSCGIVHRSTNIKCEACKGKGIIE